VNCPNGVLPIRTGFIGRYHTMPQHGGGAQMKCRRKTGPGIQRVVRGERPPAGSMRKSRFRGQEIVSILKEHIVGQPIGSD